MDRRCGTCRFAFFLSKRKRHGVCDYPTADLPTPYRRCVTADDAVGWLSVSRYDGADCPAWSANSRPMHILDLTVGTPQADWARDA